MIDFVLEDSGEPTGGFEMLRLCALVKILDSHAAGTFHQRTETGHAQTTFEEFDGFFRAFDDDRVDEHPKRDRLALTFCEQFGRDAFQIVFAIFDDGELNRESHLGRGQAYAGRVPHGVAHVSDQLLNGGVGDFGSRERTGWLPQNRFASLDDLQPHRRTHGLPYFIPGVVLRTRIAIFDAVIEVVVTNSAERKIVENG